ncbi:MAG: precorrin-3B C(17)-methyltransferase [Synergistaceae bacterium]|nr:precorrin-3B C(17)-methyltransferase [Synergistaceae bacterium]MBR0253158.1 precorrin-3B C(17)-methyltransferase [Synergistaceae bacterium]
MIYVIGIGSGDLNTITPEAMEILKNCDALVGYKKYVDLVEKFLPPKIVYTSGMSQEISRCEFALTLSREYHKNVALISSGDSGVYGMAGLMLEVAKDTDVKIKIIPGITAANSAAAILGAPLMNDYVVLSLSDLMTDWKIIEKRLTAACEGDFVICIYNPASTQRPKHFKKACKIMLKYKSPETPCGYVRNIGREGEEYEIMTLKKIKNCKKIDMLCTVIIGNSKSYILNGKIITSRGYEMKSSGRNIFQVS